MHTAKQINPPAGEGKQAEGCAVGTGRRGFVRYPVSLDAILIVPEGHKIPCVIRDFCLGGMLLHYQRQVDKNQARAFSAGDVLLVHCVVSLSGEDKALQFKTRVARSVQDGVGLAFINPEQDTLQCMQRFALLPPSDTEENKAQQSGEAGIGNNKTGPFGRRYTDLLAGCERIVVETLDSLLEKLCTNLASQLFEMSRNAGNPEIQNAYFSASEIIKKNEHRLLDSIRSGFQERLQARLNNPFGSETSNEQQTAELSMEDMSLVGDEDLGAWLAVSEITSKIEEKLKDMLTTLEERLSVMFNGKINHANNPFGPVLFAESFQAALTQLSFGSSVNNACYAVFKETLFAQSTGLYDKLNNILIEYDILPNLKYRMIRRSAPPKEKPETSVATPASEEVVPVQKAPALPVPPAGQSVTDVAAAPHPAASAKSSPTKSKPPPDLFQFVQDLRALRQDIASQKSFAPGFAANLAGAASVVQDASEGYSTSELVDAVADLQANPQILGLGDDGLIHIKSRVLAALTARTQGGGEKTLKPRDINVLEVAADLLDAMQSDPLVADSVKPWLKRLELPILKLALQDPRLILDQSHAARQVINKIAQLEFYRKEGADIGQSSINVAVEGLLEKVARERGDGVEIFSEILAKLNGLTKIQDQAYAQNVQDVIRECQEHPPIADVYDLEGDEDSSLPPEGMNKWMLRARRLREGHDVLHSHPGKVSQRLRVAWIDAQQSIYVFVNLQGLREKALNIADVARLMRRGILEPHANAADSAMDRAQYVIMQELYRQVLHESTHDSLTGLINRLEFERRLNTSVASAKRDDLRHMLFFVDIDKFSAINNNCGYAGGDRLLQDFVKLIRDDLNGTGEIARLGSDEFGILIENCSIDDALAIAERQIEIVSNYRLDWGDNLFTVTLSIGLVPISARSDDVGALLQAAESSCRVAKDMGGNRLQVFHAGHARIAHHGEVMKWAGKIDKILEEDRLAIQCQRIEPMDKDGSLQPHFEILVVVKDEQGNISKPAEFIQAAEWYRRMSAVDRHIILKTFSWMATNPGAMENIAGFAINLSGQSLNEEGFADFILKQLESSSVPHEKVCFEVTETVGITNLSDAALFIERIKEAGCRFALDDFGSGMSSYGYLKDLPVDLVKIDGAFVKNMVAGSSDYAVVKSITEIAHFMNKKVVAEYVESDEILDLLREVGVDYAQGYLIGRPDFIDHLASPESFAIPGVA